MKTRYILDENIISESPDGWQKRITRVEYDHTLKGILVTEDGTLEWFKDGYQYIKSVFNANVMAEISLEIQHDKLHNGNWKTSFIGIIKCPDCDFSIAPFSVRTPIVDDGFYARIKNNKSIKTTVNNSRSKNDLPLTLPLATTIRLFTPSTGTYETLPTHRAFPAYELFKYMIGFMTDNSVGFVSETLDPKTDPFRSGYDPGNPAEYGKYVVMLGIDVRLPIGLQPDQFMELTFDELYSEIDKKFNIGFRMEYIDGKPTMRIEKKTWFNRETSRTTFSYLRNIKRTVNKNNLFSAIELGSDIIDDTNSPSLPFPENTRYFGFKDEQFYLFGQSNLDKVKDLKSRWIISSNVLGDIFVNNNDAHDKEICLVEMTNYDGTRDAYQSNWFIAGPPYYYNEHLSNQHVINRWLDGIPQTIVAQLGFGTTHRFLATHTASGPVESYTSSNPAGIIMNTTTPKYWFDDDFSGNNHDPSNVYGNGTPQGTPITMANSKMIATAAGIYTFQVILPLEVFHSDLHYGIYREIRLKRFDSTNVLISTDIVTQGLPNPAPGLYYIMLNKSITMNATDYVIVETLFRSFSIIYTPGSFISYQQIAGATFSCLFTSIDEGGVYSIVDVTNQLIMEYSSNGVPMPIEVFEQIIDDTTQPIYMNHDGVNNFPGWIDKMKFDRDKGKADIALIGRRIDEPNI